MSSAFQGVLPTKPGSTYAKQNDSNSHRGKRLTALWATMAGLDEESSVLKVTT
jgi:hypothetical protein